MLQAIPRTSGFGTDSGTAAAGVSPYHGQGPVNDRFRDGVAEVGILVASVSPVERSVSATNGISLAHRDWGDVGAPVMVLLHATGESSASWAALAPALARSFRVVAVDLRGHGNSDWPGAYSLEAMRDDVLGLLDDLGDAAVTLVGHSLGGAVAYLVTEAEPHRVARLVVEDACPPYPRDSPVPPRPAGELGFDWELVAPLRAQLDDPSRRWWPALATITAPTLVIGGGPDSPVPQELLAEVTARVPDCQLATIAVGHMVHDNAPQEFLRTLLGWTRAHPLDEVT